MKKNKPWLDFRNTESWLKQTGLFTAPAGDMEPPPFPYQVFEEIETTAGPDLCPRALVYHDISVEQYQETEDQTHVKALVNFLEGQNIDHIRDRVWLSSDKMWMDTFTFRVIEKNPIV